MTQIVVKIAGKKFVPTQQTIFDSKGPCSFCYSLNKGKLFPPKNSRYFLTHCNKCFQISMYLHPKVTPRGNRNEGHTTEVGLVKDWRGRFI